MQPAITNDHVSDVSSALLGISCPTNESSSITASEQFYVSRGRSLKALAILCQGLLDDNSALLFDPKVMPWSAADKVSSVKPNAADLKEEVKRHASMNPKIVIAPRPSTWTLQRLTEWLNEHPISGADDVAFIKKTVVERITITMEENAAREKEKEDQELAGGGSSWIGKYPMLRLIHALIDHDNIKRAFLGLHDLPGGRMGVENRNTEEARMNSVWQMLSDKWNDPNFLPVTAVLPDLHSDFERPIPLLYEAVSHMQKATAEKVQERWQSMNLQLNCITVHWEHSGQGDGGFLNEFDKDEEVEEVVDGDISGNEPAFGSLKNCT